MMKRFLIGQFRIFNDEKHKRDFRDNFYGVEACMMDNEEDIDKLFDMSNEQDFKICVHFPLRSKRWRLRDPQFMSMNGSHKKSSYDYMEEELEYINSKLEPGYILFHYPKPVILDTRVDWTHWRFADETEYDYDDNYTYDEFMKQTEELLEYLSKKSNELGFVPVLEFDALNKYVYDNDTFIQLLDKYPKVRICLDIARLHLQDSIDHYFDAYDITKKYAKYTEVVHLSNGRLIDNKDNNHYPALPELNLNDGWADVEKYLDLINNENSSYKILFEHRSDKISDTQLESCYRWIDQLTK